LLLARLSTVTSVLAMVSIVSVAGYELVTDATALALSVGLWMVAVAVSAGWQIRRVLQAPARLAALQSAWLDWVLAGLSIVLLALWRPVLLGLVVFVRQAVVVVRLALSTETGRARLGTLLGQPAKLIALSFILLIGLGTIFLTFPRSTTTPGQGADVVDALFTATSATCVTGLAVVNTNDDGTTTGDAFTAFGQLVILVLIQIGGLGIMTLSAAVILLLGQRLGLRSEALLREVMEESSRQDLVQSVAFIVKSTFAIETVGALLLFFRFSKLPELDIGTAASYAVFTAVSAYCNAGFSLWGDSVTQFVSDPVVMPTLISLISLGGIGFTVLMSVWNVENLRRSPMLTWRRWPIHVRVVLLMSLWLTVLGAIAFYYLEFHASLHHLDRGERLWAALFQSVSLRTAGFNSIDFGEVSRVGLVVMLVLMFVGGSSGSTAGGVKTSTVAVVLLSVRSMLQGRDDVEVGGRRIPKVVVYKAISILAIFGGLFGIGFLALLASEPTLPFEALLFETMSALATVGVSTGITGELSAMGKLVVTFLMFVGRIGPLTLALAVGEPSRRLALQYPEGKIMVG
jgi:trk system potassium uptake protein TrkH